MLLFQRVSGVVLKTLSSSGDGLEADDLGDVEAEVPLDPHLEGHLAGGATDTGPVEADPDDPLRGEVDELHIAAVGLHGGADEADHLLHAGSHVGRVALGGGLGHQASVRLVYTPPR